MLGLPIARFLDLNNITIPNELRGWIIRERVINNKPISFELGCYLEETENKSIFISIPVHVSIKSEVRRDKSILDENNTGYNYYIIPQNLKLAISTYKTKKGNICPILIKADETHKESFISCFAVNANPAEKIISAEITSDSTLVLKKFIDRDRRYIGLIMIDTRAGCINPETHITINSGIINATVHTKVDYVLSTSGVTSETHTINNENNEVNKTKFIKFNENTPDSITKRRKDK